MSDKILAQKTNAHFAVATSPAIAALPAFARSVPSAGPATVKFGGSIMTSVKTKANGNLLFLGCSVAIGPKTDLFKPDESDPKNPVEFLGNACYHGHMGKIFFPNGIKTAPPLPAIINAGVVDSNAECKNRLAVAISQMADKAMAEISNPIDFYKNFKKAELGVVEKALGQYKDMGASLLDGAKNALGGVFDYVTNSTARARMNQQAADFAQSLPGKAQNLYNSTVQGASELLDRAQTLSKLSPSQMQEAVQEWLTEQFGELPCDAATMAEDMLKSGKSVAEIMGELSGEVKVQVVEAGVTVAAGVVTGGAGAVAARSAAVARMAKTANKARGVLDKGSDMLSKLFSKLEKKALRGSKPALPGKKALPAPKTAKTPAVKKSGAAPEGKSNKGKGDACPIGCANTPVSTKRPVNAILGCKSLNGETELDFAFPALYPLVWQRTYVSNNPLIGWFGQGWSVPSAVFIETTRGSTDVVDDSGRRIQFPKLDVGRKFFSRFEGFTLHHTDENIYLITSLDGVKQEFESKASGKYRRFYLTSEFDRNENTLRMHYDEATGLPQLAQDSAGRKYTFKFLRRAATKNDAGYRLEEVRLLDSHSEGDPAGQLLVRYAYDSAGDLIAVRNRLNELVREFAYKDHLMVKHSQPGGVVSEYEYDQTSKPAKARVVRSWDNTGLAFTFEYSRGRSKVTDNAGRTHVLLSDKDQEWVGHINYDQTQTTRELDSYKNLVASVDELSRATRYEYNPQSQVTRVTAPDGTATSIAYDSETSQVSEVTDALGHSTQYGYDQRGNLLRTTDALKQTTRYELDPNGQAIEIHDAKGGVVRLAYNPAGQVTSYTDCSRKTTHYRYDAMGNLVEVTNALGQSIRYDYSPLDRLVAAHYADNTTETYQYDALGRLVAHTDTAGQTTQYDLRVDGLPVKRINPLGHSLQYEYDSAQRLAKLINENGAAYAFSYDQRDRLVEETGFDGKRTDYQYNAASELLNKTDAPGLPEAITTHYQRDAAGRVLQKRIGKTATQYQYTALGQLAAVKNPFSHAQLTYDAVGSLTQEASTSHGVATTLAHSYDSLGNRIGTVLPDGRTINHLYYGSGHLHQINVDGQVISDFERDDLHRERQRSQGRLDSMSDYDSLGRPISQRVAQNNSYNTTTNTNPAGSQIAGVAQTPSLLERRYRYDQLGQLTELAEKYHSRSGRPEHSIQYSYDPLGRLAQAGNERFAFDPAHNLINLDGSADSSSSQANKVPGRYDNNRLTVYQDKRFSYDAHGNLTLKKTGAHTTLELKWDTEHQLVHSRSTSGVNTKSPIVQDTRYAYDAFGRRISKTDCFGTTHFAWDGNRLLSEQRGNRSVLYLYEPASFAPLAQLETATVTVQPVQPETKTAKAVQQAAKTPKAAVSSIKSASSAENTGASSYEIRSGENKQSSQSLGGLALGSGLGQGLGLGSALGSGQVKPALPLSSAASLRGFGGLKELGSLGTTDPATMASTGQILAAQLDGEIPVPNSTGTEPQTENSETLEPITQTVQRLYYYQNDQLGTPRELTNPDGDIAWSATYQAWGNTVKVDWTQTNEALQPSDLAADEPVHQPIRFQGQYFDAETGLHYNRFRYYDPDVGRFVSQDPIGLAGGDNLYTYAPNPTGWVDPLGLTIGKGCGCDDPCAGTATVHWYDNRGPGNAFGHYSVEVGLGGKTIHTHQLGAPGTATMVSTDLSGLVRSSKSQVFELPNAANAQQFQESALGKVGDPYDTKSRSCVTHVGEVLRAGGVDIPGDPGQQFRFLKKKGL